MKSTTSAVQLTARRIALVWELSILIRPIFTAGAGTEASAVRSAQRYGGAGSAAGCVRSL